MLFGEENQSGSNETPQEEIVATSVTPFSFWVVGHLFYIVSAREVGFGSEYAAVTELTHAANEQDATKPVISVDETKPVLSIVDLCGIDTKQ